MDSDKEHDNNNYNNKNKVNDDNNNYGNKSYSEDQHWSDDGDDHAESSSEKCCCKYRNCSLKKEFENNKQKKTESPVHLSSVTALKRKKYNDDDNKSEKNDYGKNNNDLEINAAKRFRRRSVSRSRLQQRGVGNSRLWQKNKLLADSIFIKKSNKFRIKRSEQGYISKFVGFTSYTVKTVFTIALARTILPIMDHYSISETATAAYETSTSSFLSMFQNLKW